MSAKNLIFKPLLGLLKNQWLASVLIIPLILLGINAYVSNEAAKESRLHSSRIERVVRLQDSGKVVDLALASYFSAVSELGLVERGIQVPGSYRAVPLDEAQKTLVDSRVAAREALVNHASDVQALRGVIEQEKAEQYMHALNEIRTAVDREADVLSIGGSITVLSNLVVARNGLVDEVMSDAA